MYSYLIFTRKPENAEERERYLEIMKAITSGEIPSTTIAYKIIGVPKEKINALYIPLNRKKLKKCDKLQSNTAEELLCRYDYDLALTLLGKLGIYNNSKGPYIFTFESKINEVNNPKENGIIHDFTLKSNKTLMSLYLKAFIKEMASKDIRNGTKFDIDKAIVECLTLLTNLGKSIQISNEESKNFKDFVKKIKDFT